jgi:hypothetical protein
MARKRKTNRDLPKWNTLDPDDVLAKYPPEFLNCRGGHPWPKSGEGVIWVQVAPNIAERRVTCPSCGSVQVKEINMRTWRRVRPQARIRYAPGYTTSGTGLTQSDFEATSYGRDFQDAAAKGRLFDEAG